MNELQRLMLLMQRLRDPQGGCPWDRAQDMDSLIKYTLEEVYELADTIARDDMGHLKEELGDYLFQAAFYAQIAAEDGLFDLEDVVRGLVDKLVERHPHVFPDGRLDGESADNSGTEVHAVNQVWEEIKQRKRQAKDQQGALDDVPLALPALQRAQKLQKRAAAVGFDWPSLSGVRAKLDEELAELDAAIAAASDGDIEHELGDLIFTCVNLARHLGVDAVQALSAANRRFEDRFRQVESVADRNLTEMSLVELEALWQRAKLALASREDDLNTA